MTDPSEWDLVQACIRGDGRAWKRFLDAYARWILYLIHQSLRRSRKPFSSDDAEDLLQDVLTYLVQNDFRELRKFPRDYPLKGWLRVVIAGRCWRFLKKKRPELVQALELAGADGPSADVPSETLQAALQQLPARDRLALTLFYFVGESYEEIARAVGVPAPQVGVLLSRARTRLKEILQPPL